ncbi:MAG TPA: hypothetical protein VGC15_24970 [Acetobacteraceae bacterium]
MPPCQGLLIEGGWRPAREPATEAALAAAIRRLLPEVAPHALERPQRPACP